MSKGLDLTKASDMRKFKKTLESAIADAATDALKHAEFKTECPFCGHTIKAKVGKVICPSCGGEITFTAKKR